MMFELSYELRKRRMEDGEEDVPAGASVDADILLRDPAGQVCQADGCTGGCVCDGS